MAGQPHRRSRTLEPALGLTKKFSARLPNDPPDVIRSGIMDIAPMQKAE